MLLLTGCSGPAQSAQTITLRFTPQEKTGARAPALPAYLRERSIGILLSDNRPLPQKSEVGKFADDDDRPIALIANTDVLAFVKKVLDISAKGWGIKTTDSACISLKLGLTRFYVRSRIGQLVLPTRPRPRLRMSWRTHLAGKSRPAW